MAAIEVSHVWKRFKDGTAAVRDADFTIDDGEFFILVGPSGCGKSTLLNMLVGLEDVSEGEIRVDGDVVNDVDPKDRHMAMVFQSYAIYPHMTVRENMAFPLKLAKVDKAEARRRVEEAAEMLELTDLLERKPANLSGGQRQRVAMGRAIVREPRAFLMDEPLSNLDAKLRGQMRTQLTELQRRLGVTTVYVTHDQTEAMTLGHRVAVLRKGEVQQVASPKELYRDPANLFVAGFIGSPAMNFLPAEVEGRTVHLRHGSFDLPDDLADRYTGDDGAVVVGVRPENIEDAAFVADDLRPAGTTFRVDVDLVEWLGADVYAYFDVDTGDTAALEHLPDDLELGGAGDRHRQVAARLDRSSEIEAGTEAELWLDGRAVHLFDPESGRTLLGERAVDLRDHGARAADSPDRAPTTVATSGPRT